MGTLLGDASLHIDRRYPNANKWLTLGHSIIQYDYIKFKHNILKPYAGKLDCRKFYKSGFEGTKERCQFSTRALPFFTRLRKLFYPKGKKIIPEEIMEILDWQGLAIWIGDDGTRIKRDDMIRIATESFSKEDNKMACKYLRRNLGIKCHVGITNNEIYLHKSTMWKVRKNAMLLLPGSMWYKFGVNSDIEHELPVETGRQVDLTYLNALGGEKHGGLEI